MPAKLSVAPKPASKWDSAMPTLLCFGPVFMLLGLQSHSLFDTVCASLGAVMLSVGLACLFAKQVRLEKRLNELEGIESNQ